MQGGRRRGRREGRTDARKERAPAPLRLRPPATGKMRLGRLLLRVALGFTVLLISASSPGEGAAQGHLEANVAAAAAKETSSRASRAKRRGQTGGGAAGHDALKG